MATTAHNWGASANFDEGQFKLYLRVTAANADLTYATTAALTPSPVVYNNLVWPHTMSGASNAAISVDGVTPSANAIIIVKDQVDTTQNGIYLLTTVGSGAAVWVLTRHAHVVSPLKQYSYAITTAGSTLSNRGYYVTSQVNVIGTSACTFTYSSLLAPVCKFVTEVALPNTPTYAADTITSSVNSTLTLMGVVVALNERVLVRNESNTARNGIYYCSAAGSGAAPWVLTRVAGYAAANQPIPVQTTFTCNAVSSTNPIYYNSVWYLFG
jgi:hypothetical protein